MASEALFLASAYAIALVSATDQHHDVAVRLAADLRAKPLRLLTTRAILLEIGNALARPHWRTLGAELIAGLEADPRVEIRPLEDRLYHEGFELFRSRTDKGWSLTDGISFGLMSEQGLTEALTSDPHFEQAGFTALLSP